LIDSLAFATCSALPRRVTSLVSGCSALSFCGVGGWEAGAGRARRGGGKAGEV
jgi:hypothetical protein